MACARPRLLLIEDDADTREVLVYALTHAGYDVESAPDGEVGLTMLRARRPDLVLLDLLMPRLGGRAVAEAIRSEPALAGLPVVTVSASPPEALPAGTAAHVRKPFSLDELTEAIERGLTAGGTAPSPSRDAAVAESQPTVVAPHRK